MNRFSLVLNLVKATLVPRLKQNPVWNPMTFPRLSMIFEMSGLSLAGNQAPNLAKVPPIPRPSLIREEIAMSGFSLVKMTIRPRLTRNQFRMRRPARRPQGAAGAPARRYLRRNPNPMLLTLRPPMRRKPIQGSPKNSGCLAGAARGSSPLTPSVPCRQIQTGCAAICWIWWNPLKVRRSSPAQSRVWSGWQTTRRCPMRSSTMVTSK